MTQTIGAGPTAPAKALRLEVTQLRHPTRLRPCGPWFVLGYRALVLLGLLWMACDVVAAPALREQRILRGGFVVVGNTLAQDCGASVPAPITPVGACGTNVTDSAPDVFWRSDSPSDGQVQGDTSITASTARSTAMLNLPIGAEIVSARLYWSSRSPSGTADTTVTLERPGVLTQSVSADSSQTQTLGATFFLASADVTALMIQYGAGSLRLADVDVVSLLNLNDSTVYAGWWLVVIYRQAAMPLAQISVFDGLDFVLTNVPASAVVSGFLAPANVIASVGVVAGDGDSGSTGDSFQVNGLVVSNPVRPADNFFNSSRNNFGSSTSVAGDLPLLTGGAGSFSGLDIGVADISAMIAPGQTSATFAASTVGDVFALATVVTSIATAAPDFSASLVNSAVNLSGRPLLGSNVGDTLEFTVSADNVGNDTAVGTLLTSVLEPTLQYVPGSLAIVSGANTGNLTDISGDDQAEFDAGTQTIVFRLGAGASATSGGQLAPTASTAIRYRATVLGPAALIGTNIAIIQAQGLQGAPIENTGSNVVRFSIDALLKDGFE